MDCNDETTVLEQRLPSGIDHGAAAVRGDESNLYEHIDRDKVWGLNLSSPEQASICIKPWDQRSDTATFTESGVDDQFILTIPFIVPVKIKSLLLNPGRGDFAPQRVRAFVNRPNGIDFEEVEVASSGANDRRSGATLGPVGSGKPQADFALLEGAVGVTDYPVSISRFANTNSVSIVFSDAPSQSLSRIFYLGFRGTALQLKKDSSNQFDVPAANAADKPVDGVRERRGAGTAAAQGSAR